ncbi:hypothetical protein OG565_33980 (plasmid) [Streptomyces sp. NBC_00138]|uniref:hypothetical protein n=1 Tax=Streptomyces sp. NBC_00138 TaxID=2903625 RepID=UPI002F911D57
MTNTDRCPAAHPEDPTPCSGPPVVTVVDAFGAGDDGCEHHGARLLASITGARVFALPDAPEGSAIRVFKAASHTRPFAWYENAPRTEPSQLSDAENRAGHTDPATGEGFDAPTPAAAYGDGKLDVLREGAALLRESTRRSVGELDDDPGRERDYLLRRAALADRMAVDAPGDDQFEHDAVGTAEALLAWDRRHPEQVRGPIGPGSPEWDPSARPYVRQEWAARPRLVIPADLDAWNPSDAQDWLTALHEDPTVTPAELADATRAVNAAILGDAED